MWIIKIIFGVKIEVSKYPHVVKGVPNENYRFSGLVAYADSTVYYTFIFTRLDKVGLGVLEKNDQN